MLTIEYNKTLKALNTFKINAYASKYCEIACTTDIFELINSGLLNLNSYLVIGGGSNLLFTSDFDGLIIKSKLCEIEIIERTNDYSIVSAGSGLNWHKFLRYCINSDLYGLENLSKIPGTVGAAPVQNIGAYGIEQKDCFHSLTAINLITGERVELSKSDCQFDYRYSIFKSDDFANKYFIESVRYKLNHNPNINANYKDIQDKISLEKISSPDAKYLFKAIEEIRDAKLPDPEILGNAGSFFKNPIINLNHYNQLLLKYPDIPSYSDINGKKIPAAWLIEKSGLKGYRVGDAGISEKHSLILINYADAKGIDIYNLSELVINTVKDKFDIELEREVIVIQNQYEQQA